jgi:TetR/AcrR family transcriptional repressor of nem operon
MESGSMARGQNRERLIAEGMRLLRDGGFQATGVQEITDACGVPKGSFYNYFDSKTAFGVEVLEAYARAGSDACAEVLSDRSVPALERLRRFYVDRVRDMKDCGFRGGCLVGNLTQEMADRDDAFRETLERVHAELQGRIAETLREAQSEGDVPADRDPDLLAEFLVNAWHGALLRMKSAGNDRPLQAFLTEVFERMIPGPVGT